LEWIWFIKALCSALFSLLKRSVFFASTLSKLTAARQSVSS
jgi:hypothetical protein